MYVCMYVCIEKLQAVAALADHPACEISAGVVAGCRSLFVSSFAELEQLPVADSLNPKPQT